MKTMTIITLLNLLLLTACSQNPHTLHIGEDACEYCRMIIIDERFAAQLVTEKGKSYLFDSIECLGQFVLDNRGLESTDSLWVSNYMDPGDWVHSENALFFNHPEINSPMGYSLLAVRQNDPGEVESLFPGVDSYRWGEIKVLILELSESGEVIMETPSGSSMESHHRGHTPQMRGQL